jgi:3-hydroxyacyl-[acyl-carrier-protein] dehydratase
MATLPFVNLDEIDLTQVIATREQIYQRLPQRHEFMQLDAIVHIDRDKGIGIGLRNVRADEFWVRGHIPGRPLLPGVLMLETAAQMAAYLTQEVRPDDDRFMGFGGLENVKFRAAISPPATLYVIEKLIEVRRRRTICDAQGICNGQLAFEARIIGLPV